MSRPRAAFLGEQLRVLLPAAPVVILLALLPSFPGSVWEHPVPVLAVLLVLLSLACYLGLPLYREHRLVLGGGFVVFLLLYVAVFWWIAGSGILDGPMLPLPGYEREPVRPPPFGLGYLGDWRYRLMQRTAFSAPRDLEVVVLPLPRVDNASHEFRRQIRRKLREARQNEASAVAFDIWFGGEPYEGPDASTLREEDRLLCEEINRLPREVPVAFGFTHRHFEKNLERYPIPESLKACERAQWTSLTAYTDGDGRLRRLPLYLKRNRDWPTLSTWLARELRDSRDPNEPATGFFQFNQPSEYGHESDPALFRDSVVLVGWQNEQGTHDLHETPFGSLPGVDIHAWAALSLASGKYIRRLPEWCEFLLIFLLCYALGLTQARGGGGRALLAAGLALTVTLAVAAVLAISLMERPVWLELPYPLLAVWILVPMLAGGAQLQAVRARAARAALAPAAAERAEGVAHFHVFLSYSGVNRAEVVRLAEALRDRGLRPWLDEWEIRPGDSWLEALEKVIETVASTAVLVGKDRLGPWQEEEMQGCLQQCKERGMQVIPVLLPSAPETTPDLPLFLKGRTWVDLRGGLTEEKVDRLEWGITGIKPRRSRAA